ncbi:DUF3375 family protein [Rhodococcus sp. USK13]|uniref:DUF3375 family protein n=1 Tax=Rhodococcus sp. USK13 TaxID=2806442 RepID=UPI001BD0D828|nr:DUF3375 family protein [Rhodococcus sp. USK13]
MSDALRFLDQARLAAQKPSFRMLRKDNPEIVVAILRTAFPDTDAAVDADTLHSRVDAILDELTAAGERVPRRSEERIAGRDLCQQLVADQLLGRSPNSNNYTLAPGAVEALEIVDRLGSQRALANSSRLTAILKAARDLSAMTTVDRESRLRQMQQEIERMALELDALNREYERIRAGGDIESVPFQTLIDAYEHLTDLVKRLPTDLARVRESVDSEHRRIIRELREDERSTGQSVIDHLELSDALLDTPEGRAFRGVRDLLGDRTKLSELKNDLSTILSHAVFEELLPPSEHDNLYGTPRRLRDGLAMVQDKRNRTMETLSGYIVSRGLIEERELAKVLNDIGKELNVWLESANSRTVVPFDLMPDRIEFKYLHERFDVTLNEPAPPPAADTSGEMPVPPTLAEIVALGGPRPETLYHVLDGIEVLQDQRTSLGEVFNTLDPEFRRPVELFGLWQAAATGGVIFGSGVTEPFYTVRPDGTTCAIHAEKIILTPDHIAAIRALEDTP